MHDDPHRERPLTPRGDEARERIIQAAVRLFARKGYAATGIRALATEAGANIAMINYYFGGKEGVMKAVIDHFFERYMEAAGLDREDFVPGMEGMRQFLTGLVSFFLANRDLVRVFLIEFPEEVPDLPRHKAAYVRKIIEAVSARHGDYLPLDKVDPRILMMAGPTMISGLASHILLKPTIAETGLAKLDDDFYRLLPQVLADFLLPGIANVLQNALAGKYRLDNEGERQDV